MLALQIHFLFTECFIKLPVTISATSFSLHRNPALPAPGIKPAGIRSLNGGILGSQRFPRSIPTPLRRQHRGQLPLRLRAAPPALPGIEEKKSSTYHVLNSHRWSRERRKERYRRLTDWILLSSVQSFLYFLGKDWVCVSA